MKQKEKRKAVEKTLDELYEWINELHVDISDAKSSKKEAKKGVKLEPKTVQ